MQRRLKRLLSVLGGVLVVMGLIVPITPAQAHGLHVLLFTKTASGAYRHDSIPAGITMMEQLASQRGWEMTKTEDASVFNDATLATYNVIVMLQTSGMVWDTAAQRTAMQNYMRKGGGVVAIHNATDMNIEQQFPWWDQMLGMTMTAHSSILQGTAKVADHKHPSGAGLPDRWTRTEEWYNFDRNARGNVHVLATADETTYDAGPQKMGVDHPISWCRNFEGGRVWATGMGHNASSYTEPLFRQHITGGVESAGGIVGADCGPTVWSSFQKVQLDNSTVAPSTLDVAPDGRVFFNEYNGNLKIYKPDTRTTVVAGTLSVYGQGQNSEDGLVGMVLDPAFATNKWVYLNYSPSGSQEIARVSRFTMNGDKLDMGSEKILLTIPASRKEEPGHTGGQLNFGPNGNLYISVGDDTNPNGDSGGYAPIDERAGRSLYDAQGTAANTNDLRGKILRIHPEADGTYTVPSGNMFAPGTAKTRPEIYAMGFRNPFRISVHPTTGVIYAADYGPDAGGDNANRGPAGLVEWNVIKSPGYYGWPYCVANNIPYNDWNFANNTSGAKFNCASPVNNSPNNTGLTTLPASKAADLWYGNGSNGNKFPEMGDGGEAPMAFPAYQYNASNPSPTKFPAYFDQTPFFGEWSRNRMWEFRMDSSGNLLKVNNFLSNMSFASPMDAKFGPDGSMYLLTWGTGWDDNRPLPGSGLWRIDYTTTGERLPVAQASASPLTGPAPLTVRFSSAGSSDPGGLALTYRWTFGDGTSSTEANPSHTYTTSGKFTAQLTVTNSAGKTGTANVVVSVGNTEPVVRFTGPVDGGMINFGDPVPYTLSVTDQEDGTIDCGKVTVQSNMGHDTHKHPIGSPMTGCTGMLQTAVDSGHQGLNVHVIGSAEYTDNGANGVPPLTGSAQVVLQPKQKQAEFFNGASGVNVVSQAGAESGARVGDISNGDWISFKPVNFAGINQVSFRVSAPSGGGGTIELRSGSPTGTLIASSPVTSTGSADTYVSTPAVNVTAPTGTVELFAVFKTSSSTSFDLDSITYVGPGAGQPGGGGTAKEIVGASGKCVDVNGASSTDGAKVQLWTCNSGANQKWTQNGTTLRALDKCLEVNGNSQADGAIVRLWSCNGSSGQNWTAGTDGTIRNGTKCLDANGGSSADGTQLIIWTCHGGTNQRWTFR